jgi:hypothetical protein
MVSTTMNLRTLAILPLLAGLLVPLALAQEPSVSLGELARKERERKAAAAKSTAVIDLVDLKKDCGGDWSCFLAALDSSKPARLAFTDTADVGDVYGVVITSQIILEMSGFTERTAVLTGRPEGTTARLTDPARARLLLSGFSREMVAAREQEAQAAAKRQDGQFVTCTFQRKALKQFLENRKDGEFSEKDWDMADQCGGFDRTVTNPFAFPLGP